MPKTTITSAQNKAIDAGFIDLMGESKDAYKPVTFTQLAASIEYLALQYTDRLKKSLRDKDADSSGSLSDSILARDVVILGSMYTVEIEANKYADFIDEGVNGWANSRGSKYSFRTKGVDPASDMVKNIKAWLMREGNISSVKLKSISSRETKRQSITDASTKAAVSTAFMIKRQGIAPTNFWSAVTTDMKRVFANELSAAVRIDIIENLGK